ncbi:hypothetical protein [Parerythrobacter aestuarii]|uniref:hypothetical protein n=1 Tax=Parerythrobacter aestuarii TaxID=3020909 RepID=UPI0024DDFAFA|nr:hypothetical protein [Parerythrobacter aestuarii]
MLSGRFAARCAAALLAALQVAPAVAPALAQEEEARSVDTIAGEWVVDLRLSLDDAPYTQPMVLVVAEDGTVTGTFYGATIEAGKRGSAQGRTCIAFRTSDGSGPYQHAACLVDGKIVGQSWSEGRGFVLPWTAQRK